MRFALPFALLGLATSVSAIPYPDPQYSDRKFSERLQVADAPGEPHVTNEVKYFHEPCCSVELAHYDNRFFKERIDYEQHIVELRNLIRAYLTISQKLDVETWMAHGTLLGWAWNGKILPWDVDIDVQVSMETMRYMAQNLNGTEHAYEWTDASGDVREERYLLDINPYFFEHAHGEGLNIIDARWINMANGAFIDITALAESDPVHAPGVWVCKNSHQYTFNDLFPLRETTFEGVPALVPYNVNQILADEYGSQSLVVTEYNGHTWEPIQQEWVKVPEVFAQKPQQ